MEKLEQACSVFHLDIAARQLTISHVLIVTAKWHLHLKAQRKHSVMHVAEGIKVVNSDYHLSLQIPEDDFRLLKINNLGI